MTRDFDSLIAGATPAATAKRDNMQTVFVTQSPATVYKTKADYLLSGLTVCLPIGCFQGLQDWAMGLRTGIF